MKKQWGIGLLSVFPGAGLLVLGKPIAGVMAFIVVALFIFLGVLIPNEDLSITSYTLAVIAWGSQLYYAVLIAQHLKRIEDGCPSTLDLARSLSANNVAPQVSSPSIERGYPRSTPVNTSPRPGNHPKPSGATRSNRLLRQAGISSICIFAGYAAMYGILIRGVFNAAISEDPFLRGVLGDVMVQLICGLPTLLPAAFIVASWVRNVQKRRKLLEPTTQRMNAIASFIIGAVAFFPCQFMLIMGAAL